MRDFLPPFPVPLLIFHDDLFLLSYEDALQWLLLRDNPSLPTPLIITFMFLLRRFPGLAGILASLSRATPDGFLTLSGPHFFSTLIVLGVGEAIYMAL